MKNTEFYRLTNGDVFRRDARYAGIDHRWFEPRNHTKISCKSAWLRRRIP
jgi:hypothetical protein